VIKLKEVLQHPATIATAALTAAAQLFQIPFIDAFIGVIWGQLGTIFTAASILSFSVVPNVDLGQFAFAGSMLQSAAIVLAIAYASKLGLQAYDRFTDELDQ
jgi:hypothetical protein